ncbi:MAG: universal stress protein [Flavobacteriaceae bacterium]
MHKKFKKILTGLAFSPNFEANLYESIRLSNMFDSELILVHVGEETKDKKLKINKILEKAPDLRNKLSIVFQSGDPVEVISSNCKSLGVDLLIIGAQSRENIFKHYLGSIARKLTRKAGCSVLLLIKQSLEREACKHIVVNGLKDPKTEDTIETAFYTSKGLGCQKITIVEEIKNKEVSMKVSDDRSLRKVNIDKQRLTTRETQRVKELVNHIEADLRKEVKVKTQSIFGKTGYSIGHYAKVVRADLLVMNEPKRTNILDRIFPHDLEYILSELPTNVLIVR